MQGVKNSCRVSLLTNTSPNAGWLWGGGRCGFSANEYSCAHHVIWSPNKLCGDLPPSLTYGRKWSRTPTKRPLTERLFTESPLTKRPFTESPIYRHSLLSTNRPVTWRPFYKEFSCINTLLPNVCGSGIYILDPWSEFFHPGSASKNLSRLTQKNCF